MLDCRARFLKQNIAQGGVLVEVGGCGGSVCDGEIFTGGVRGEKDGDVVDLGGGVWGVRGEGEAAVGCDVEGDFY